MLLAYAAVAHAPWYYYWLLLPLMGAFVYIPVCVGAILCLEVMFRLPRQRRHVIALAAGLLLAALLWFFWSLFSRPASDVLTPGWFQDMLGRLQLTEQRLLPNWWLSSGLLTAAGGEWSEAVLFLVLMIANALFFRQLAAWTAARIYRRAYSRAAGAGPRKRVRNAWPDQALGRLLDPLVSRPVRLMLVKDLRLFRRDPVQWSQFLILVGLLFLYFLNVHPFGPTIHYASWVSMVSFMNLAVVGLLMSTFTTRFIFPMLSLEGRRFWLLGLLPLSRDTILWSKFLFAIVCLLLPGALLVLLSDYMLGASGWLTLDHQLTCLALCPGFAGIAVGLGARLPNLRESSPSRIAAGFGGTLNLVLSALYLVALLVLMTLPCHFYLAAATLPSASPLGEFSRLAAWLPVWLVGGTIAGGLLGILATALPLWIGIRAFRKLEF
jgi:ABC-2 type transport system permease protein